MFNNSNGYSLADIAAATGGNNRNDGMWDNGAWWIIILFLFCFNGGMWGNGFGRGMGGQGAGSPAFQGTTTREKIAYGFDMNDLQSGIRGVQQGLCDGLYAMNTGMLNGFAGVNNAVCSLGYQTAQLANGLTSDIVANRFAAQQGVCQVENAINQARYDNTIGQNSIAREISDCCCENGRAMERGFADINYNMATNTCAIQTSMANHTRDIIDSQNAGTRAILDYLCQEKISDLQSENQALRLAASQQAQNNYLVSQLGTKAPVPAYVVANPYCNCGTAAYGCGLTA